MPEQPEMKAVWSSITEKGRHMATEYFQSELFASEMDAAWLHNIRYDKDQDLSEAQKAKARNNMGAASFGSILKILGHYNTVEELQSNAEQNVGDAYSVGTAVPYKLYIFDGLSDSWLDYGFIRSQDISSRSIQNVAVPVSAWTQETDVLAGYSYKAQIALADSSTECFPIVVFESEQAFSGNFASIAFAVAGYVEIFTKTIPTKDINVAAVTVIVNGGIGKGITNASADIADGSVTRAKLATNALISPVITLAATYTVIRADTGKTLRFADGNLDFVLHINRDTEIPVGATYAIFRYAAKSNKIVFGNTVRVTFMGNSNYVAGPTFTIPDAFGQIAIMKFAADDNYDYWHVSGPAEAIT